MNNLAAAYWSLQRLDQSVPLFEGLLPLLEMKLGREHIDTQNTLANLGVNYKDAGRLEEAVPLLEEAYKASRTHASLGWVSAQLLDAYAKAGETAKHTNLLQEALADARKSLPEDSPQLASLLVQVGSGLLQQQKWAEAELAVRQSLLIREAIAPNDWTTYNTQSLLGGALLGQDRFAEAEPLLLTGYEGMK